MQNKLRVLAILDRLIPSNIIGIIRPFLAMQKREESNLAPGIHAIL